MVRCFDQTHPCGGRPCQPINEKPTSYASLPPDVWKLVYDLGFDLRLGKSMNLRLLPIDLTWPFPRARELVPDPTGLGWAFHVGDRRALISNKRRERSPRIEGPVLGHALSRIVAQFESTTDDRMGCDEHGLAWTMGGKLFPGSGVLYAEFDDHDERLPLEERKDRQTRFLAALDGLLGPDRLIATKHPSISDTGHRGAFGAHTWSYFDFDAQKPALARLRADVAKRAGIPEACVECHSGVERGMTRFIIDPEYSTLTSSVRRIDRTIAAVHDEIYRLRALVLRLPRCYADPVPGEPIRKTLASTGNRRKAVSTAGDDPISKFSYGAGERYAAFFRIAGRAGAVARDEKEAGDLAWDLAIKGDRGSRDMADAAQRASLERDIRQLAARSFQQYGGRRPEYEARFVARDATGASESYEKDGFVLPDLTPSEEEALREHVVLFAGHLLPRRPSYREAALDSIVLGYRYFISRYLQDKDRTYENEDLRRLNGYALMERRFFDTLRRWGVENPLRCREVLLASGVLLEAPPSPIDGRRFRWTGKLPHFGRHFKTLLPAEIPEDSMRSPSPTGRSDTSL
jgi:hypothetical protein